METPTTERSTELEPCVGVQPGVMPRPCEGCYSYSADAPVSHYLNCESATVVDARWWAEHWMRMYHQTDRVLRERPLRLQRFRDKVTLWRGKYLIVKE